MKKVLFNATTLVKGGALQVAIAFIRQALVGDGGVRWHFVVSKEIAQELTETELAQLESNSTIFDVSPARSKSARQKLTSLADMFQPDVVFTLFGPAYVIFKEPHICGVADGWVTHSSRLAFKALNSVSRSIRMALTIIYKAYWYRKADVWIVEANIAKIGLLNRLKLQSESIHVVPNTCSQFYRDIHVLREMLKKQDKIRLLCLSAFFPGKNLEILPEIAQQLVDMDARFDFEFVVTLPNDDDGYQKIKKKAISLGVANHICNIGPVRVREGPKVYESCHIAFLPSLLETFSANYPEAMAMKLPIVTTDLRFAHDACKDAALYFEPRNARSAAENILKLVSEPDTWKRLVDNGSQVLKMLPTPEQRFRQYIEIIKNCSANEKP